MPVIDAGPTEDEFVAMPVVDAGIAAAEDLDAALAAAEVVDAGPAEAPVTPVPERVSRSGTAGLKLTARLAPNQKSEKGMVAVLVESEPSGVVIKVDKRELGRTPATLHFKNGLTFDLWFEAKGKPPLRQWLMLTGREGKPPKVTLRDPAD